MLTIVKQRLNALPDKRVGMELTRVFSRVFPNDQDKALTAHAGGGQAAALALNPGFNFHEVSTVATAGDSIALPPALVGSMHFVKNSAANAMQVFGSGTDTIDAVATATGVSQLAGEGNLYVCMVNGNYSRLAGDSAADLFTSITGSAATFPINGLAAAQGGSVTVTGGTSSTSGNAGGAVALAGGLPGATGVGGAVSLTGAIGGATSGAGGAASITGGAGTAGNAAGGAASLTSGAGQGSANSGIVTIASGVAGATGASGAVTITSGTAAGGASGAVTLTSGAATGGIPGTVTVSSGNAQTAATAGGAVAITGGTGNTSGAGGAVTITSGAAGSTGVAGAVNIAVGAATAGAGSNATITGGNGAGGTAAGGNVNLVPGTAVSTGTPGEFQVNSVAGTQEAVWQQYLPASVPVSGQSYTFFMANRAYRVKAVSLSCSSTATVPSLDVIKDTGTGAPGGGSSVLASASAFNTTANTRVIPALNATVATITLAAGDRLAAKFGGTVGSITGAIVSVLLVPA